MVKEKYIAPTTSVRQLEFQQHLLESSQQGTGENFTPGESGGETIPEEVKFENPFAEDFFTTEF